MEIEFAHCRAVRPGRPFSTDGVIGWQAEQSRAAIAHMGVGHGPRRFDRAAIERGDGDRRIVDDAVDDHVRRLGVDIDLVGGDRGDLPGELVLALQVVFGTVGADVMDLH